MRTTLNITNIHIVGCFFEEEEHKIYTDSDSRTYNMIGDGFTCTLKFDYQDKKRLTYTNTGNGLAIIYTESIAINKTFSYKEGRQNIFVNTLVELHDSAESLNISTENKNNLIVRLTKVFNENLLD